MKSEQRLRLITENMVDCVALVDTNGTYQYVTPSYSKTLGYDPEDMIGITGFSFIHPDDLERITRLVLECIEHGWLETSYETRFRHKNGHYIPLEIRARSLKDPQGKIVAGVLCARDITDRRQLEQGRRENEERYRALVDNASDIVYRTDENGYFTFVNPAALRIIGYKQEEAIGMHYPVLIHPDMRDEAMKLFGRQFVKGLHNTYSEFPIIAKDGHEVWLGQNTQLIMEDGNVKGFQSVARDITERKQAQEQLQKSEERYRTILEDIDEGYFEIDLAGNFTFVNDAECRDLGYSREELIGMNSRQYSDEAAAKNLYEIFSNIYKTGKPVKRFPGQFITKDGSRHFNELSASLIRDAKGKPIGFRGVSRDITERKQAEEALQESEKRYQALSIVDELTQCYNSRHFYAQLKIELERSSRYELPLTLLLLDLDDFKAFNDAYGHVEGDRVLTRLGQVVKRCLRETDSAYRYGGEEFTILLPMTISADGAFTAERIRTELRKETFSPVPGRDIHVTVSIGLGQYKPQEDMKAFVHRVDQLMYQGKKNGKNRIYSES